MLYFVTILHVILCILLILVILLQPGKGSDVGAAFGGGVGSAVFGPRGPANFLGRATTVVAILFMGTSVTLALNSSQETSSSSLDDELERLLEQKEIDEPAGFEPIDIEAELDSLTVPDGATTDGDVEPASEEDGSGGESSENAPVNTGLDASPEADDAP